MIFPAFIFHLERLTSTSFKILFSLHSNFNHLHGIMPYTSGGNKPTRSLLLKAINASRLEALNVIQECLSLQRNVKNVLSILPVTFADGSSKVFQTLCKIPLRSPKGGIERKQMSAVSAFFGQKIVLSVEEMIQTRAPNSIHNSVVNRRVHIRSLATIRTAAMIRVGLSRNFCPGSNRQFLSVLRLPSLRQKWE